MTQIKTFFRDDRGGPAAEFALVLPLALIFLFGLIDVGRYMWEHNEAEKATQMGTRFAAVTDLVPKTLASTSFVSATTPQGGTVPSSAFGGTRCISGSCNTVPTNACPSGNGTAGIDWGYEPTAFTNIVNRIRKFKSNVAATNVIIDYANAGLGYAGDPIGSDVAPLITVRLCQLTFRPITTRIFNASVAMPDFSYSLTTEDGAGIVSN